jgi:2'-hydroxybiphenyl-2-sulfinate desulfinase
VPSASGIAIARGLLETEYARDGITVGPVTDGGAATQESHFSHGLSALFREGGNVPAMAARSGGARTTLLGLTFVPEFQAVAVLPTSPARGMDDLVGRRLLIPDHGIDRVDFFRAMSLRGYHHALAGAGATLEDCELVAVARPPAVLGDPRTDGYDWEVDALKADLGDAVSIKGAHGADLVIRGIVRPVWSVDTAGPRMGQVNNGTPRTITVSSELAGQRPDIVERYLRTLLRAARWGASRAPEVAGIVSREIGASLAGVEAAYGARIAASLSPSLDAELVACLEDQKRFLLRRGFIRQDFDLKDWIDPVPLSRALALEETEQTARS